MIWNKNRPRRFGDGIVSVARAAGQYADAFSCAASSDIIYGPRVETLLAAHGAESPCAESWVVLDSNDNPAGAIGRFYGSMYVILSGSVQTRAHIAAVKEFLDTNHRWYGIEAVSPTSELLADAYGVKPESSEYMVWNGGGHATYEPHDIKACSSMHDMYSILCVCHEGFADSSSYELWSRDYALRIRAGRMKLYILYDGHTPIGCASINAMNRENAILGSVSILPEYRRRGYGHAICAYCVNRILELGRTPVLQCGNDSLVDFYTPMGFVSVGRWASVETACF